MLRYCDSNTELAAYSWSNLRTWCLGRQMGWKVQERRNPAQPGGKSAARDEWRQRL